MGDGDVDSAVGIVKPRRILDLYCKAGGAAMGYHRAWPDAEIVGVDIQPQRHYPFTFVQADAMDYPLDGFDFIHASPPCQHYAAVTKWSGDQADHPDLLDPTRQRLLASDVPWIIENVPGAPLRADYLLCGSMFGLRVQRHRLFETSWRGFAMAQPCDHRRLLAFMHKGERAYADAMECHWMSSIEAREAIPPAYTEYLAGQMPPTLRRAEVAHA